MLCRRCPRQIRRSRGVTLIELMLVIVVMAILAAIALPSYQQYVLKGRRAEAIAALNAIQQAQERYRANSPSYAATLSELAQGATSPSGYYGLSLSAVTASGYTITAKARGQQAKDKDCDALVLRLERGNVFNRASDAQGEDSSSRCWPQ